MELFGRYGGIPLDSSFGESRLDITLTTLKSIIIEELTFKGFWPWKGFIS